MKKRLELLDLLRGIAMIYVMLYHLMFDMRYIYGMDTPSILTPGDPVFEAAHKFFLWILFAVSGICVGFSRDPLKRGVLLYLAGFGITAATQIFMPEELIVFGVLSCFGACMVLTSLCRPVLEKLPPYTAAVWAVLWVLTMNFPVSVPHITELYPLGIIGEGFSSADYFPLIPNIFMFLAGFALSPAVKKLPESFYEKHTALSPLCFIGRHSLIFYIAHQPVMLLICELIAR